MQSDERQRQAKRYEAIHNRLFVVEIILTFLLLAVFLVSGASKWLAFKLSGAFPNPWLHVSAYVLACLAAYQLIFLPENLYSGFVLEHRFGLSNQKFGAWALDQLKSFALNIVLGLLIVNALYFLLRRAGDAWWIWAGICFVLFGIVMSNLFPVLILPIFYKLKPLENESLRQKLVALAERVGARVIGVFRMEMSAKTKKANAAFAGLGNTKRIILGDTLLENFAEDEIEVVMAHEMAHYKHNDVWLFIGWGAVTTFVGLYIAHLVLVEWIAEFRFSHISDIGAFPLFVLAMFVFGMLTMPLNNAFSRWRERLADRKALELTQNPDGFIRAMHKLADQNLANLSPNPVIEFLLYSHPSISRRIAFAEKWQNR
jgi:STE24 endopeptidase